MEQIKNYIIAFLVIVILIFELSLRNHKIQYDSLQSAYNIAKDSTKHYRDKNGSLVAQTQVMQTSIDQLKGNVEQLGFDKKKLETQVGSLDKIVLAYQSNISVGNTVYIKGKDTTIYSKGDTIKAKNFKYTGKYLNLKSIYNPKTDFLETKYQYSCPLLITVNKKSDGLFKGYHLEGKASMEDPNAKLDNQKIVFIDNTKKRFYEKWWFNAILGAVAAETIRQEIK